MLRLSLPASFSIRAPPLLAATALRSAASLAPVTVLSTSTTTWLVTGSTDQAVPTTPLSRLAVRSASSAALRSTTRAFPPAAWTALAAAASVTVTTIAPDEST
jgi:hypothetical protein